MGKDIRDRGNDIFAPRKVGHASDNAGNERSTVEDESTGSADERNSDAANK